MPQSKEQIGLAQEAEEEVAETAEEVMAAEGGEGSETRLVEDEPAPYETASEGCVTQDCTYAEDGQDEAKISPKEDYNKHDPNASASQCSGTNSKSKGSQRSDVSENNSCHCRINKAPPCCRTRKCACPKDCPPGTERVCIDPCCCNPCIPTPYVDNIRLKEENKELRRCIKRVRDSAMNEACDIIKDVICGCKCSCCVARQKLKPCKSSTVVPCRETWMCVPMPGSNRCGGYTPSGWNKLLKKCRELTSDPCSPCDMLNRTPSVCVPRRNKCLPLQKACPPCPHLCPTRSLPSKVRPFTPCCPLYFPGSTCPPTSYTPAACGSDRAAALPANTCCNKSMGITPPPYKPMYLNVGAACTQPSASALAKAESIIKEATKTPIESPPY